MNNLSEVVMDKSYIIRIYKQERESVSGVVEDIEQNERFGFSSADELWELVTSSRSKHSTTNLIKLDALNTKVEIPASGINRSY